MKSVSLVQSSETVNNKTSLAIVLKVVIGQLALSGCGLFGSPAPYRISDDKRYLVHLVRSNDETLSQIAWWYTKDSITSNKLYSFNSKVADDGLQIGEVVIIPSDALKTVAPMPRVGAQQKKTGVKKVLGSKTNKPALKSAPQMPAGQESTPPTRIDESSALAEAGEELSPEELSEALGFEKEGPDGSGNAAREAIPTYDAITAPVARPQQRAAGTENLEKTAVDLSIEELVRKEQLELERQRRELEGR